MSGPPPPPPGGMPGPGPGQGIPIQLPGGMLPGGIPMPKPGEKPSPEQLAAIQKLQQDMRAKIEEAAQKAGVSPQEYVQQMQRQRAEMIARAQAQQQAQQQQQGQGQGGAQGQQGQPGQPQGQGPRPGPPQHAHPHPPQGVAQPITPGPPNPVAIAMANFLRGQDLKPRTCILNGERKEMFRVKRALRALQTPAYEKARKKNPALPEITDRASLENAFKLLPMSMLALRVEKMDPNAGQQAKKSKRVKGLWTVKIVGQQDAGDDMYYAWLYEGSQVMRKVYAVLALIAIFIIVCYPLWPLKMRLGVYYLSWGFLWLLAGFFAMAIFRVILFCITYFILSPGLWLFPNLWEDVSFVDSFKPVWAWHETAKKKKKSKSSSGGGGSANAQSTFAATTGQPLPASATTTATDTQIATGGEARQRPYEAPRVEELGDDE